MRYFLPGQLHEWKVDKQVSFFRGLFIGGVSIFLTCFLIFFMLILPKEINLISEQSAKEILLLNQRLLQQRDELGVLHGLLFVMFGKNTPVMLEQFRRKQ